MEKVKYKVSPFGLCSRCESQEADSGCVCQGNNECVSRVLEVIASIYSQDSSDEHKEEK